MVSIFDLKSKIHLLKDKVDFFEESNKSREEMIEVFI